MDLLVPWCKFTHSTPHLCNSAECLWEVTHQLGFWDQVNKDSESFRVLELRDVCTFSTSSITNLNGNTTSYPSCPGV
jgi:hypothetical protein